MGSSQQADVFCTRRSDSVVIQPKMMSVVMRSSSLSDEHVSIQDGSTEDQNVGFI